jgi:hypothetical protein
MEVPEWVHVVSHGTAEELREFIGRNPGFDWDGTTFEYESAFVHIVVDSTFPLTMLDVLYTLGGARFDRAYTGRMTPLRFTITSGVDYVIPWLLERDVPVEDWWYLIKGPTEMILEHSTALTLETVEKAERFLSYTNDADLFAHGYFRRDGLERYTLEDAKAALWSWRVSHDRRQTGAACVAWVLSRPIGGIGSWPDMTELVSRCLLETRVKDW